MVRNRYADRPPLYGMGLVFLGIAVVAVTAALHTGWWSILGYGGAAVVTVIGLWLAFGDLS